MDHKLPLPRQIKPSDFPEKALDLFHKAVCRWETLSAEQILTECAMLFLLGAHLAEEANANATEKARPSPKTPAADPSDQQIA